MNRCCSRFVLSHNLVFISRRYASSDSYKSPLKRIKRVFYTTVGLTLIGAGGSVVYAKEDPKFRKIVDSYIPGFDRFVNVVYQESGAISFDTLKDQIYKLPDQLYKQGTEAIEGLTGTKTTTKDADSPSIKERKAPVPPVTDKKSVEDEKPKLAKENQEAPVLKIGDEVVTLYKDAIKLLEAKDNNIPQLIDKAVEESDLKLWNNIRKQIDDQNGILDKINRIEKQADELSKKFSNEKKTLMSREKLSVDGSRQLSSTENQLNELKSKFQSLKKLKLEGAKNYFDKIETGRKHFLEELNALFPGIRPSENDLKLSENETDMFLYYAVKKLNYYQKEIAKLESQASDRYNRVLQGNPSLQETVDGEVAKARRQIKEDFDKNMIDLKSSCEKQLHEQLKRQEQVHIDILNDQLKLKEQEVERKLVQQQEQKVQEEKSRLTQELAIMTTQMQALNEAISKRALQDMRAQTSQGLWNAAEAMYNILKRSSGDETGAVLQPKPLSHNVEAIKNAAAKGDDLVETVLATIPKTARDRGVFAEDTLRKRFIKVESVAWRVAGVPEDGASLPMLLLTWLQSKLILRASEPIPLSELNNEAIDPSSLSNYDVLQRARYWVDRGDFEQALKYMNLLTGGARSVSLDWMNEVTLLLEAQQAASLLLAHASASGMIYS